MKKVLSVLLLIALLLGSVGLLSACSNKETLIVYNWEDYIDPEVVTMFEEEYGVSVRYEKFTLNEHAYTEIKNGGKFDIVIPSDYMIEQMIEEDMLAEIDVNSLENYKYIDDSFKNLAYDKDNKYSVPYMWGTIGILYNTEMVTEEVKSWNILWDEKYKGQILMQDSERDCFAAALAKNGLSINTTDDAELTKAKNDLLAQKPLVYGYYVDETKELMANNAAALAVMWSGDAAYAMEKNDKLDYALPEEGTNKWFDSIVVPKNAPNKELAMKFIDFLCRPDIAAKNVEYIYYSTPNKGAEEYLDEEMLNDHVIFPPDMDYINNKCEVMKNLGADRQKYLDMWSEIKGVG